MDGKHRDVVRCYVVKLNWYWKYGKAVVYKLWPKIDSFRIFLADNQRCVPRNRVPGKLGCVRKKVLMMAALMGRLSRCALGQSACFSTQVFVIKCDCGGSAKSTFLCLVLFSKSRFVSRGRQDLVLCFISVTLFSWILTTVQCYNPLNIQHTHEKLALSFKMAGWRYYYYSWT